MRSCFTLSLLATVAFALPANAMCGGQAAAGAGATSKPMCGMMMKAATDAKADAAPQSQAAGGCSCCAKMAMPGMDGKESPAAPSQSMPDMPGMKAPKTPAP